jgi:hypothetical protein
MTFPEIAILLGVLVFVGLSVHLIHKYWPYTIRQKHNDVAGFIFAAVAVFYAVMVAFVVVVGWEDLSTARQTTYTEANQLANIYWISRSLPSPQGPAIENSTLEYAHTVIDDEWPLMEKDESSPRAQLVLDQMRDDVFAFTPRSGQQQVLDEQAVTSVNELSAARRNRLVSMNEAIGEPLWVVLIIGGVITVCFCLLFGLQSKAAHYGMVAALAVLVVLSLLLIKEIQYPFAGNPHIGPEAFEVFLSQTQQLRPLRTGRDNLDGKGRAFVTYRDRGPQVGDDPARVGLDRAGQPVQHANSGRFHAVVAVGGLLIVLGAEVVLAGVDLARDPGAFKPGVGAAEEDAVEGVQVRVVHRLLQVRTVDQPLQVGFGRGPNTLADLGEGHPVPSRTRRRALLEFLYEFLERAPTALDGLADQGLHVTEAVHGTGGIGHGTCERGEPDRAGGVQIPRHPRGALNLDEGGAFPASIDGDQHIEDVEASATQVMPTDGDGSGDNASRAGI